MIPLLASTILLVMVARRDQSRRVELLTLAGLQVIFYGTIYLTLVWVTAHAGRREDLSMSRLDGGASILAWQYLAASAASLPLKVVYQNLSMIVALGLILGNGRRLFRSLAIAGFLAVPCYLLIPACGPAFVGNPHAPPNCFPSLHLTSSLLVAAWLKPPWRTIGISLAGATALATLSTGEHYLLDLVAAFPYTWLVIQLEAKLDLLVPLHGAGERPDGRLAPASASREGATRFPGPQAPIPEKIGA